MGIRRLLRHNRASHDGGRRYLGATVLLYDGFTVRFQLLLDVAEVLLRFQGVTLVHSRGRELGNCLFGLFHWRGLKQRNLLFDLRSSGRGARNCSVDYLCLGCLCFLGLLVRYILSECLPCQLFGHTRVGFVPTRVASFYFLRSRYFNGSILGNLISRFLLLNWYRKIRLFFHSVTRGKQSLEPLITSFSLIRQRGSGVWFVRHRHIWDLVNPVEFVAPDWLNPFDSCDQLKQLGLRQPALLEENCFEGFLHSQNGFTGTLHDRDVCESGEVDAELLHHGQVSLEAEVVQDSGEKGC